ncbi:kinesin light chain [Colletotrichum higginsianum]|nr:kinesin light chain [Colletotrichum higginsianum]
MASHSRRRRREDFQIAVICALPLEYDAVVFACDEIWEEDRVELGNASGDCNTYKTGRIGGHNVVLLLLPGMGKVNAATAAASLRSSYTEIKLAILCGICGGVPGVKTSNEVFLGDVVISKSIVQYDLGRKYPNRFAPKDTVEDTLGRPSQGVRSLVATFQTLHGRSDLQRRASQVLEQIQQRAADEGHQNLYRRPAEEDRLFEPDYLHRHRDSPSCGCSESEACEDALTTSCEMLQCDHSRIMPRMHPMTQAFEKQTLNDIATQEVRVLVGRLGSGDTVLKAGLDRDRIAKEHNLLAFEMEGAGIWDVFPCIVVKAVCDYADSHKNKKWQHFAAATAASATKALLEHYTNIDRPSAPNSWCVSSCSV